MVPTILILLMLIAICVVYPIVCADGEQFAPFMLGLLALLFLASFGCFVCGDKAGQIKALTGHATYSLQGNPDGTVEWKPIVNQTEHIAFSEYTAKQWTVEKLIRR